jgi:hypothetical protein
LLAARIALTGLALGSIGWAVLVAPVAWRQATMAALGAKIVGGERFDPGILEAFAAAVPESDHGLCAPVARRTLALVRLRLAEAAISDGDGRSIRQTQSDAQTALRQALSCAPTDAFLWFALFWLENNISGLQPDHFTLLRLSYRTGANEGWLSLRRNPLAIAIYPRLPEDLKEAARDEFSRLVKSDFLPQAAEILAGPGQPIRPVLLARLDGLDPQRLRFLSRLLDGHGIELAIPGLSTPDRRPADLRHLFAPAQSRATDESSSSLP